MNLTNRFNLPSIFERYDRSHQHTKGGAKYSVTTLIDSPKISRLRDLHHGEATEDISDRILAILGTAVHEILQTGAEHPQVAEQRLHAEINGVQISGQIDLQTPYEGGMILSDYKTTHSFTIQSNPAGKSEWEKQLNSYRRIAELNGVVVTGLEVIAIIRDWSASGLERSHDYPEAPIIRVPIKMWSQQEMQDYVENRVAAHEKPETSNCTSEEMWASPTVFAVHEPTRSGTLSKRAKKLFNSRTEATSYAMDIWGAQVIERPGSLTRCEGNYCRVSDHCDQFYNSKK